jgi:hypothetical protein
MKYQFRPYAKMQPVEVTLTGKVYEKGEHPTYTEYKIIEVIDKEGELHYAFEDELTLDEVEKQETSYNELSNYLQELADKDELKSLTSNQIRAMIRQFKNK